MVSAQPQLLAKFPAAAANRLIHRQGQQGPRPSVLMKRTIAARDLAGKKHTMASLLKSNPSRENEAKVPPHVPPIRMEDRPRSRGPVSGTEAGSGSRRPRRRDPTRPRLTSPRVREKKTAPAHCRPGTGTQASPGSRRPGTGTPTGSGSRRSEQGPKPAPAHVAPHEGQKGGAADREKTPASKPEKAGPGEEKHQ